MNNYYEINSNEFNLRQIAKSGQCFRFNEIKDGVYLNISGNHYALFNQEGNRLYYSCSKEEFDNYWINYFDLNVEYPTKKLLMMAQKSNDDFLYNAISSYTGMKILNQDLYETLISFVISRNNNIPKIRKTIEKICEVFGEKKILSVDGFDPIDIYLFPKPEILSQCKSDYDMNRKLVYTGVGYRLSYIIGLCEWFLSENITQESFLKYGVFFDTDFAMKKLMSLKGIGSKVASCVCLFGLHMMDAVPIDTWMKSIIKEDYEGVKPEWMSGDFAGLLQQYAFEYKRSSQ